MGIFTKMSVMQSNSVQMNTVNGVSVVKVVGTANVNGQTLTTGTYTWTDGKYVLTDSETSLSPETPLQEISYQEALDIMHRHNDAAHKILLQEKSYYRNKTFTLDGDNNIDSQSMNNSKYCFESSNLDNCISNTRCHNCDACNNCIECRNCDACNNCIDCRNCAACNNCIDCRNCAACNNCIECRNCDAQINLHNGQNQ